MSENKSGLKKKDNKFNAFYHYCSQNIFHSIVKNKEIWLTDITKSNDSMEIQWILKKGEPNLYSLLEKIYDSEAAKYFKERIQREIFLGYCKNSIEYYFKRVSSDIFCYVICFSTSHDLLSQWRGYADDAKGVAIGFSKNFLRNIDFTITSSTDLSRIEFGGVSYRKNPWLGLKSVLDELISDIKRNIKDDAKSEPIREDNKEIEMIFQKTFKEIFVKALFTKSPFFAEEKEWRLCIVLDHPISIDELPLNHQLHLLKTAFHINDSRIFSYIKLNFSKADIPVITDIIIGPKSLQEITDVKQLIKCYGSLTDEIQISASKGTYQ
ncbi:MAG: DUF2971 domain-containing protein [Clostridiales Family XIII bacterium]|jgi:hypothetical protein|nr:DUF2971 domain-containing protein [Clostridiales Family XIII bacterium]